MAINERLIHTAAEAAAATGTGNQEDGLVAYFEANDVDSYDGDGSVWYDIANHEFTPAVDPSENFNTVTYSGNSSTNSITGVGFAPDFVWIKGRNYADHHGLFDTVRGDHMMLASSANTDTTTNNTTLTSFDSDGFTLGTDASDRVNDASKTYVAWCLKAGGAPTATNTATSGAMTANSVSIDGALESAYTPSGSPDIYPEKMSVNNELGFSIVKYDGTGAQETLPHGLGQKPELMIFKRTNTAADWLVTDGVSMGYLNYNSSFTKTRHNTYINSVDENTIELKNVAAINGSSDEMIAYCFASKRGVSKVGTYTGTGATGNKIYTGFEPAWVMVKKTNATGNWIISDQVRGIDKEVYPNLTNIDNTDYNGIQSYNADGFTLGTGGDWNQSGKTFIYLAFAAEKPSGLIDDTDLALHFDAEDLTTASNTTWTDKVNSVALTKSGTVAYDDELGDWVDFGSGYYGNDTATTQIKDSNGDCTVEFWYNFDQSTAYTNIVGAMQDASNRGLLIGFHHTYGMLVYNYKDGTMQGSQFAEPSWSNLGGITYGKWYHVVVRIDASTDIQFYINGVKQFTSTSNAGGSHWNTLDGIRFGDMETLTYTSDGQLGQIRIYKGALSADEILQNYRFTKNDYPNGYNATLQNGASWNSGGYMVLDGANDKISIPDADVFSLEATSKRSFSVWFKDTENSSSYRVLFSKGGSNKWEYAMFMYFTGSNRGLGFTSYNNGASSIDARNYSSSNTWLSTNTWHHLVVTVDFDAEVCKVYIDGTERASDNDFVYGAYTNTDPFIFGGRADLTNNFFQGHVNNFKLFDKVLTQTEITALKDAGYQG